MSFQRLGIILLLTIALISLGQWQPTTIAQAPCSPAYPEVCIPLPPPDLDCKDIPYRNFKVLPPDPHRFDGDKDGIGCEQRS
ncbi:calcium-binding protein with excalibur domain protein [Pantanalinema rosaneae CENA516]|uniref:excalibur calcium-binding domain-containing protein n=1 Tax=Pantanalinema rosaneae TaxID=1620701 RepID=UPI003D6E4749